MTTTRVLVALSVHRNRPGLDVRVAAPEEAEAEITRFRPHLLVHNDTAPIDEGSLGRVPCRVEVLYSDGLDACVSADGKAERVDDASTEDLLGIVDRATEVADAEAGAFPV